MEPEDDNLIQDKIRYLWEYTDFASAVFDNLIGYAIVAADFDGNIIIYSKGACEIYGYAPHEVIGKKHIDVFFSQEFIKTGGLEHIASELFGKEQSSYEGERVKKDGTRFPAHILFIPTKDKDNRIIGFVEIVQDLTEQKLADEFVFSNEARLRLIVDSCTDGMIVVDKDGIIRFVNPATISLFARSEAELLGSCFGFPVVGGERTEIEIIRPSKYGTAIVEMNVAEMEWSGKRSHLVSLHDITERKKTEEELKTLSLRDSLTGFYNRLYFEEEMHRLGSGRFDPVGIIMCDIDGLKLVNDTLGHSTGDELILTISKALRDSIRESDIIARVGGDEFAILLPNTTLDEVQIVCRRFEDYLGTYNEKRVKMPASMSIGHAVKNGISPNISELYKIADNNMYKEKLHKSNAARNAILEYLVNNMEEKNIITKGRSRRVKSILIDVANDLGMSKHNIHDLCLLAQFHDIGTVGVPERIMLKPGDLIGEEIREMRIHVEMGYRIVQSAPNLVFIAKWILKHHEWWNGKGYPLGLKEKEIPLECRVVAIADAYDSITHDRPHRKALTHEEAAGELRRFAGIQFDPEIVEKFIEVVEKRRRSEKTEGWKG